MKVLHVMPSYYPAHCYGGPVQSVYHLCLKLAELGCDVRVLTTDANGPDAVLDVPTDAEVELARGLRVRYAKRLAPDSLSFDLLRRLPGMVRWADVVHVTAVYSFPVIPALVTARIFGKPVVWSPRGSLQRWSGSTRTGLKDIWDGICQFVRPRGAVLHVTSEQEAAESLARYPKLETATIPNGVEVPADAPHRESDGALRLVFLGRLHPKKGIENLLDACASLESDGFGWSLVIAGAGDREYTASLEARIASLRLGGRVTMAGELIGERKQELFENADIAVFPSYTENFAMVVAEALAHGVPVIASTGTPWRELETRRCGLWVDNDPLTIEDAIRRMAAMPRREMGLRGREWMLADFSWERAAADTAAVYARLSGAGRPLALDARQPVLQ